MTGEDHAYEYMESMDYIHYDHSYAIKLGDDPEVEKTQDPTKIQVGNLEFKSKMCKEENMTMIRHSKTKEIIFNHE